MAKLKASKHIIIDDEFMDQIKDKLSQDIIIQSRNYNVREASIFLNMGTQNTTKLIREGKIEAFKIGSKKYYVTGKELERYINSKKQPTNE